MRPVTDLERRVAPFEVISDYVPSGDQPAAIEEIERRVKGGTKDVVLPYCGGVGPAVAALASGNLAATPADPVCPPADQAGFPPVEDVVGEWARLDGCAASPQLRHVADDVEQRTYADCRGGAAAVLYSVVGGGHTWPGSKFMEAVSNAGVAIVGHTTVSIDATRVIWSFFQRYALPS